MELLTLILFLWLSQATLASPVVNGGFETGDFTGWSVVSGSQIEVPGGVNDTGLPENGTEGTFGVLYTGGPGSEPTDTDIEAALGLSPGALDALVGTGHDAIEGSAIYQTVDVRAGHRLTFDARFVSDEPFEANPTWLDFAFYSVTGAGVEDLFFIGNTADADTGPRGPFDGASSPFVGSYTFASSGTYIVGFGVLDDLDQDTESGLVLNNVAIVPEINARQSILPLFLVVMLLLGVSTGSRRLRGSEPN